MAVVVNPGLDRSGVFYTDNEFKQVPLIQNPFALGDSTRSTRPPTTWLLGSFGYSNPSTTITLQFKEFFPHVEEFKYLGVLFTSEGRMDHEIDRWISAAAAVMWSMYRSVVVKSIYVPTLTYGHELWVMTERIRSRIQAAEMSFLRSVVGRSLRDRVRSSITWEEFGVEPLLLHINLLRRPGLQSSASFDAGGRERGRRKDARGSRSAENGQRRGSSTEFRTLPFSILCSKTRGGGVCVYINTEWCRNSVLVSSSCSLLMEFVTVRCRPFYLPREFTTAFLFRMYIPPSANAKEVLCELNGAISGLQNAHPDRLFIIAGDFNHANLKSVLPKFHQHVDFAMRGTNTLDLVYTNILDAYRAEPHPHLDYSDHISVMLISAYRLLIRRSKQVLKQVKTWPAGAISALQDCFECTD
ncbi:hypothetical protein QTP70_032967 [Hemibagrus guttatus]|uniref:Endonuclease/exonuclease/phosphatase domain-containing protein n=1 Tax=Hemibagrus guttatus TaxID=175788 RepID=A0AAE0V383_9TELE|nr:hypothetical protein QTP70_032967 [Hemibagrus guttatus]